MPLYEYRCRACENVFEYMQTISERPKRKCEECGGRLEKLVSRAGFVLKGSGWYETDFREGGSRTAPKNESKDGDSSEPASSSDSPPAKPDKPAKKSSAKKKA